MSFFKRLKDKFAKNDKDQAEAIESPAQESDVPQEESEQQSIEETTQNAKDNSIDWNSQGDDEFDDGLISIEEFEEIESQKLGAKFREGLEKSRANFQNQLNHLLAHYRKVDEDFFEALEEMLIQADVGFNTVMELVDELRMEAKRRNITETEDLREVIVEKIVEIYHQEDDKLEEMNIEEGRLNVIIMIDKNQTNNSFGQF